jgi:hypothetical protein
LAALPDANFSDELDPGDPNCVLIATGPPIVSNRQPAANLLKPW